MNIRQAVLLLSTLVAILDNPPRSTQPPENESKQSSTALHKRIRIPKERFSHIQSQLAENEWSDIISTLLAYSLIGLFHWIFWKRFLMISARYIRNRIVRAELSRKSLPNTRIFESSSSENTEKAYEQGINVRLWVFLFYATFGFVITFSTRVAGVLLVFVFFFAPAILAVMVTKRFGKQLLVGWGSGTLVTVIGMYLSAHPSIDLPCGHTVVAFSGLVLALGAVLVYIRKAQDRQAVLRLQRV